MKNIMACPVCGATHNASPAYDMLPGERAIQSLVWMHWSHGCFHVATWRDSGGKYWWECLCGWKGTRTAPNIDCKEQNEELYHHVMADLPHHRTLVWLSKQRVTA